MSKRIGILTSGGDCAGLNAVLRAVTYRALGKYGWEVIGIEQGTTGLLKDPIAARPLTFEDFHDGVMRQGGTLLGTTNKGNPFNYPKADGSFKDLSENIIAGYKKLGLDALIGIGGDGSLAILRKLAQQGEINFVGIPKTIDNDIGLTESSIGFSTAVDVATEAIDRLQPTAASHDRVMILEVMGRDAGHIALHAGIAGGADVILMPEIPYTMEGITNRLKKIWSRDRNFALVVVAEATKTPEGAAQTVEYKDGQSRYSGISHYLSDEIMDRTGAECRFTVLGHVQRGGQPNATDRLLATAYGVKAVDLVNEGKFDRMVSWNNRDVTDVPLEEAVKGYKGVDPSDLLVRTARSMEIYVGEV